MESKPYGDILREILVISPNSADLKPFINALIDYGDPLDDEFRKELFTRICRAEYTSLRDAIFNKLLEIDSNLINMRSSFGETPLMLSKYALNKVEGFNPVADISIGIDLIYGIIEFEISELLFCE